MIVTASVNVMIIIKEIRAKLLAKIFKSLNNLLYKAYQLYNN